MVDVEQYSVSTSMVMYRNDPRLLSADACVSEKIANESVITEMMLSQTASNGIATMKFFPSEEIKVCLTSNLRKYEMLKKLKSAITESLDERPSTLSADVVITQGKINGARKNMLRELVSVIDE